MNAMTEKLKSSVSSIMTVSPIKVGMEDPMDVVADMLDAHRLSSVPVVDPITHECFGIISLTDINHLHALKVNLKTLRAWEACTYKPIVVPSQVSVEDVARLMVDHRVHHILITEDRKLKGFVSSLDIIAACMSLPLG